MEANDDSFLESASDEALTQIFISCDTSNSGQVKVSELINYMKPYMTDDLCDLDLLQNDLDPDCVDPTIDIKFFCKMANIWTSKIKSSCFDVCSNNEQIDRLRDTNALDIPMPHSTPNSSFSQQFVEGKESIGVLDSSKVFSTSFVVYAGDSDKTVLEEKINSLTTQNEMLAFELNEVKLMLEQVEGEKRNLAEENKRLLFHHNSMQHVTEENKKLLEKNEEINDRYATSVQQNSIWKKSLGIAKQQNFQLARKLHDADIKIQNLEEKVKYFNDKDLRVKEHIRDLQEEIKNRDLKLVSLETSLTNLTSEFEDQNEMVKYYANENERINNEKAYMESILKQQINESLNPLKNVTPNQEGNDLNMPYATYSNKQFNTPKLLKQLANPVSPNFENESSCNNSSAQTSTPHKNRLHFFDAQLSPIYEDTSETQINLMPKNASIEAEPNNENLSPENSSEEDFHWKLILQNAGKYSPHVSLQDEISQVNSCITKQKHNHDSHYLSVQSPENVLGMINELKEHEDCPFHHSELIEENKKLKNDYNIFVETNEKLNSELDSLKTKINSTFLDCESLQSVNEKLKNELQNNIKEIESKSLDNKKLDDECKSLYSENKKLNDDFEKIIIENTHLNKEIEKIQSKLERSIKEKNSYETSIKHTQNICQNLQTEVVNLKAEIKVLSEEKVMLQSIICNKNIEIQESITKFNSRESELKDELEKLKVTFKQSENIVASYRDKIGRLEHRSAELIQERNCFISDNFIQTDECDELKERVNTLNCENEKLVQENLKLDYRIKELNDEIKVQKDANTTLYQNLLLYISENENIKISVHDENEKNKYLSTVLQQNKSLNSKLSHDIDEYKKQLEISKCDFQKLSTVNSELKSKLENIESAKTIQMNKKTDNNNTFNKMQNRVDKIQLMNENLKEEVVYLKKIVQDLTFEKEQLEQQNIKFVRQIENVMEQQRERLEQFTSLALNYWQIEFDDDDLSDDEEIFCKESVDSSLWKFNESLHKEVHKLKKQVDLTVFLLNSLCKMKPLSTSETPDNCASEGSHSSNSSEKEFGLNSLALINDSSNDSSEETSAVPRNKTCKALMKCLFSTIIALLFLFVYYGFYQGDQSLNNYCPMHSSSSKNGISFQRY